MSAGGAVPAELPRVRVISVGGTISSASADTSGRVTPSLTAGELVSALPALAGIARVETHSLAVQASAAIDLRRMLEIAAEIRRAAAGGCDGVVVTHGTGTIEETVYAAALMCPRDVPVVFTGAMRNPTLAGSDGPANLLAAVRVAATRRAAPLGPVLVANDEIHAARWVTKTHSTRLATFRSEGAGPVGQVVEDRVELWFLPAWEDHVGQPAAIDERHAVELIKAYAGMDALSLTAAVGAGRAGVVLESIGPGTVAPALLDAIDEAVGAGIAVIVASRCVGGGQFHGTYRMAGSETDLQRRGALLAGNLSGPKARLRLVVGLACGREPADLFPVE